MDVATYAENSEKVFETWGFKNTHQFSKRIVINLYGAPGTGKTMAAHAIAKNLGRKILIVNYADIESKFVGETPKNIRKAFEAAKKSNSILFFDEADAILSKRVTNMTQAVDVSVNQTRSVMLMLMNEYQDFIIFATNFISNFDPAFMRRISMHVKFELPDEECRKKLWAMYIPKELPNNLDIDELAKKFSGISGSDIANAMLNSAFKTARLGLDEVDKKLYLRQSKISLKVRRQMKTKKFPSQKKKFQRIMLKSRLLKEKGKWFKDDSNNRSVNCGRCRRVDSCSFLGRNCRLVERINCKDQRNFPQYRTLRKNFCK